MPQISDDSLFACYLRPAQVFREILIAAANAGHIIIILYPSQDATPGGRVIKLKTRN